MSVVRPFPVRVVIPGDTETRDWDPMKKLLFKETRGGDVRVVTELSPAVGASLKPETFAPFRTFSQSRHSRSRPGVQWMKTTGTFLPYESRLESDWLLAFDFDADVVAVSTQPMDLRFGISSSPRGHVPDMFLRLRNGVGIVVGVSSSKTLQVSETAAVRAERASRFCERLGWRYRVVSDMPPCRRLNLRFLAGYRTVDPVVTELFPALVTAAGSGCAVAELVDTVAGSSGVDRVVVRAAVFAAVWDHHLVFDVDSVLTDRTVLTAGGAA